MTIKSEQEIRDLLKTIQETEVDSMPLPITRKEARIELLQFILGEREKLR